ncbi:MAG: GtrA family protein [Chlorobi bacterium]|nr:GtrA family protein [Chlorobiota bacterium]
MLNSFFKYNIVAIIATSSDFLVFILLFKIFKIWYVEAAFTGAVTGGFVAFILNRKWTFIKKDGKLTKQAIKYLIVWTSSIFLNTYGLYLFVESSNLSEVISKIIVSVSVGIGFNYFMYKYFVFK